MYRFAIIAMLVTPKFCMCCGQVEKADEKSDSVIIPLKDIWAYRMPGTRDVQKIDNNQAAEQLDQVRRALSAQPPKDKDAAACFVVVGNGPEALHGAHSVLVEGKKPRAKFPRDSDLSLVFFSYQFGPYVHIQKVLRSGDSVEVQYRFVPHKTEEVTEHFALIPLGKFRAGQVQVQITQLPIEQRFANAGWSDIAAKVARRIVCRPFSFVVE